MITLKIGNEERKDSGIKERWIAQQIKKRRKAGQLVCVKAIIRTGMVNVLLSSGACAKGGGGHLPNRNERKLIELWNKRGLNGQDITAGMIISFLSQYGQYV